MSRYDYYNDDGNGKFMEFVRCEDFKEENINEEIGNNSQPSDCSYLLMDKDFPFHSTFCNKNKQEKEEIIFNIIKYCCKHQQPPQCYINPTKNNKQNELDDIKSQFPSQSQSSANSLVFFFLSVSNHFLK